MTHDAAEQGKRGARVSFDDVWLSFGGVSVLRGLTFEAEPGETVVLAGPSGGGKSSALKCVLGFVAPSSGTVSIDGDPVTPETIWRLRKRIAYVPQEPVLGGGTVRAWIDEQFGFSANASLRENLSRLPETLGRLNLPPSILDQQAEDLSGGEKQRAALASALLLERPLILLDEPVSALDPESRGKVYGCLAGLDAATVMMVSHDRGDGTAFADRVIHIGGGKEDGHGSD